MCRISVQIYDNKWTFGGHIGFFSYDYCIQSSRNLFEIIPYVQKPYNSILNHYNVSSDSGYMRHYILMAAILDVCIFNLFPQQ